MAWFGKLMCGYIGFAMGGPLGAIVGAALGHNIDETASRARQKREEKLRARAEATAQVSAQEAQQSAFFVSLFSMLGKLVIEEGAPSRREVETVKSMIDAIFPLDKKQRQFAYKIFEASITSKSSFDEFAAQFRHHFSADRSMLEMMIDLLLRVATADGRCSAREEELIYGAAEIFGFTQKEYSIIRERYIASTNSSYAILGVDRSVTDAVVKKAYRKMAREYHPDKVIAQGLPEEFVSVAQEKFKEIQNAYEAIKRERGMV